MSPAHGVKPSAERRTDRDQVRDQRFDFSKPYLGTEAGAAYVDSPSPAAFRMWLRRQGIVTMRRGRRVLVARKDLDVAIGASHRRGA